MKNILIIGASSGGHLIADAITAHKNRYNLVGLLDGDPAQHGKVISGVKVIGGYNHLKNTLDEYHVDEVIVAIANLQKEFIYEFIETTLKCDVGLRIIPSILEKNTHDELFHQLRPVNASDLLGRPSLALNEEIVSQEIEGKTVLVTGAAGSIGSEIIRQLVKFNPKKLVAVDINENDLYLLELFIKRYFKAVEFKAYISNIREIDSLIPAFNERPEIVFHAAAHKHVPLMETAPVEAIKNNILGTMNVLQMTTEYSVDTFVLISSDKAVKPTNVMGATKRFAEKLTALYSQLGSGKYMSVRFGNVLGSKGSVIPIFKTLIEEGQDLTVTHPDTTRYFMTIPEAAQLVIEAGCRGQGNDLFMLDMGEPIKIMDLAEQVIKLSGLEEGRDIKIIITGLRPGEKLHEELFYEPDSVERIENSKILQAKNSEIITIDLKKLQSELENKVYIDKPRAFLKSYVESYQWDGQE